MRSLEIIVSLSLAFGVSALAAPVNPRSKLNTPSRAHEKTAATDCESETGVPGILDVASPVTTLNQDVSSPARSGDNADIVTTATDSIAPSSPAQFNPISDGASGDLSTTRPSYRPPSVFNPTIPETLSNPSERSSLNAVQLNEFGPSAASTLSRSSQATDIAQLASGAMAQFLGSDLQLARTPNSLSTSDVIPNGIFPAGGNLGSSFQTVSSQDNTLGSNLGILQSGTVNSIPLASGPIRSILSGNGGPAPSIQAVSSQDTFGSSLNVLQSGAVSGIPQASGPIRPILSGGDDLTPFIQAISSQCDAVDVLGSSLNIDQNGAVYSIPLVDDLNAIRPPLSGNDDFAPFTQVGPVSLQGKVVDALGSNLGILQSGAPLADDLDPIRSILSAGISSGKGDFTPSIQAVSSQSDSIPQDGAVNDIPLPFGSILPVGVSSGNSDIALSYTVGNLGSNLNIPQNAAAIDIHLPSGLDSIGAILPAGFSTGSGDFAPSIQAVPSQGNVMNLLGSNLNIIQPGAVNSLPLASGLDVLGPIGPNIARIPMTGLLHPVQAASLESNTLSDPLKQSSFTDNFPDSLNPLPRISNGAISSEQIINGPETNIATTTGNCICDSYESAHKGYR